MDGYHKMMGTNNHRRRECVVHEEYGRRDRAKAQLTKFQATLNPAELAILQIYLDRIAATGNGD